MATEFKLPELGENINEGDVVSVLVGVGDAVNVDQPLLELETGKATVEVPAEIAGTVTEIRVREGDKAQVGQVVMVIEAGEGAAPTPAAPPEPADASDPSELPDAPDTPPPAAGGPIEVKLPALGEGTEEGDVLGVLVAVGDTVAVDQPLLELETGKATVEVPAEVAGNVIEIRVRAGDKARVGQVVLVLESAGGTPPAKPAAPPSPAAPSPPAPPDPATLAPPPMPPPVTAPRIPAPLPSGVPVAAAPSVRKFARELGVDITQVKGLGPGGRIRIEDVKSFTKRVIQSGGQAAARALGAPALPDFARWGEVDISTMSGIRKATAEHMARCWAAIPHVTQTDKADITRLEALRKQWKAKAEQAGGKLTPTAILLKIVAGALKAHPQFNSSIDVGNNEIIRKKYIHIGVAVDTPKGLMVPVIRDVDRKNIIALAVELTELAGRARDGKLGLDEMQGGSFTITNLGGIGGSYFTPIVNHPEVAILGVSRAATEPVYVDGAFVPRLMMPLSLSYDHRVIDGADGARFIRWICEAIEEPLLLAMEG